VTAASLLDAVSTELAARRELRRKVEIAGGSVVECGGRPLVLAFRLNPRAAEELREK